MPDIETPPQQNPQVEIFFENWNDAEECQRRYEDRVIELTQEMIRIHGTNYNPTFHDKIIKEVARGEIVCEHYEHMIANDREGSANVIFALKNERAQLNKNREMLQLNTKAIAQAKRNDGDEISKDVKECLLSMLMRAKEEGDI